VGELLQLPPTVTASARYKTSDRRWRGTCYGCCDAASPTSGRCRAACGTVRCRMSHATTSCRSFSQSRNSMQVPSH